MLNFCQFHGPEQWQLATGWVATFKGSLSDDGCPELPTIQTATILACGRHMTSGHGAFADKEASGAWTHELRRRLFQHMSDRRPWRTGVKRYGRWRFRSIPDQFAIPIVILARHRATRMATRKAAGIRKPADRSLLHCRWRSWRYAGLHLNRAHAESRLCRLASTASIGRALGLAFVARRAIVVARYAGLSTVKRWGCTPSKCNRCAIRLCSTAPPHAGRYWCCPRRLAGPPLRAVHGAYWRR